MQKLFGKPSRRRGDDATPLQVAVEGLVSGMGGALALSGMVALSRAVMSRQDKPDTTQDEAGIPAGEALSEGPEMPPNMNRVTATFVQKVATGLFGTSLDREQQDVAGTAWHLLYGGFWGSLYALLQSSLPVPKVLLAPLYGLGVWWLGPGWLVPKMKLMRAPGQQPRTTVMVMAIHAAYAMIVALILRLLRDRA